MLTTYPISRSLALTFVSLILVAISLVACSDSDPVTTPEIDPGAVCPQLDPHPIGESIAEKFDVPYKEVMDWFCKGESFEDILLGLQTRELTGRPLEELFAMKNQMDWENIWKDLNIVP